MGRLYMKKGLNSIWGEKAILPVILGREKFFEKFVSVRLTESGSFGSGNMGEPPQYRILLLVATGIIYVIATIRKIILEHIRLKIKFVFDRSLCENVSALKWEYFEDYTTSNKINSINEKSYDCIIMRMFEHTCHYLLYILSTIVFSYFLLLFHWMIMVLY